LELPLSYKAYFSNLKGFEFRYIDKAYYILFFAFLEMLDLNIIIIRNESDNKLFVIKSKQNIEVLFSLYKLLLRPLENNQPIMELQKYIYRIGIYGYYSTNTFSKHSIKKVILKESFIKDILLKKGFWPFISYKLKYQLANDINQIDFEEEKNKYILKINHKLNFKTDELEIFINTVHSNLLISLDTVRPAITLVGK
jgi:hypothetical protein